jgi:predicted ester cyclase
MTTLTPQAGDQAKALFRGVVKRVWHRGELSFIDAAYSPNFAVRVPRSGCQRLAGYKQHVRETLEGLPDVCFHVKAQYSDGPHLISRFQMIGTHTGPFLGIPATGRPVDVGGVAIHRMADGRYVEGFTIWDVIGLCHEIGLVPGRG